MPEIDLKIAKVTTKASVIPNVNLHFSEGLIFKIQAAFQNAFTYGFPLISQHRGSIDLDGISTKCF